MPILYGYESKPWYPRYPEIDGLWMVIPQNIVALGFDPCPYSLANWVATCCNWVNLYWTEHKHCIFRCMFVPHGGMFQAVCSWRWAPHGCTHQVPIHHSMVCTRTTGSCHWSPKGPSLTEFRTKKILEKIHQLCSESSRSSLCFLRGKSFLFQHWWGFQPQSRSKTCSKTWINCSGPEGVLVTSDRRKHRHISHLWFNEDDYPWRIHGAGIYANMTGVYWWDPCYHI